jgi:hypothetical protein
MSVPGFTAEATLYRVGDLNYIGIGTAAVTPASSQGIVPQNIECDIYIFCVDGIRYLKRDCPDGSGDTTKIGVCPPPPPPPPSHPKWWLHTAVALHLPWSQVNAG